MQGNYIDAIVFVFLLIEFFVGLNAGAILFISDVVGSFIAFLLAKNLTVPFANFLSTSFKWDVLIGSKIENLIQLPSEVSALPLNPSNLSKAIQTLKLPQPLNNFLSNGNLNSNLNIIQYISYRLGYLILLILSFIALFLVILILFRVAGSLLRKVFRVSPFLKWIDVIFGGLLRVLLYVVVVSVIVHLIGYVFSFLNLGSNSFLKTLVSSKTYEISEKYFPIIVNYFNSLISNFR